jgi:hypothetical protein
MLVVHFAGEYIPNDHFLFYRIHKTYIQDKDIPPNAMKAKGEGGMSTDWSKYCDAATSLERAKNPKENAIVSFSVREVRELQGLSIKHRPVIEDHPKYGLSENYSHSEIDGIPAKNPFKTRIRAQLANIAKWEIKISNQQEEEG